MNIATKKRVTSLVLAGVLVSFASVIGVNCSGFAASSSFDSLNGSLGGEDKSIPVGFLSSEQILKSMISVAGVENLGDLTTSDDNDIDATYQLRKGSLPSVQDLSAATGPTLIAITNLAASVCNKAVNRDAGTSVGSDRLFFNEVDFSKGLSAQSATAFRGGFDRLARNAWRREANNEENDSIDAFVSEFRTGSDLTSTAQTRLLAVSVCTAVLSSADALTY